MRRFDFVPELAKAAPSADAVSRVVEFLLHGPPSGRPTVCVISGAGISTESGIPDYRSPDKGSYSKGHKPLTHQEFTSSDVLRKRYWARSVVASTYFEQAKPNLGHLALAKLEQLSVVDGIVTQNVDRLHRRAGSKNVLELHGHTDSVACLGCGTEYSRPEYHRRLQGTNIGWFNKYMPDSNKIDIRADGDADLGTQDYHEFLVPGCSLCGGTLMPTIVFFGGSVPAKVRDRSFKMVEKADKILVVGSSLAVYSSYRLCKAAREQGKPIGIINAGETRADDIAALKIGDQSAGPLLDSVAAQIEEYFGAQVQM